MKNFGSLIVAPVLLIVLGCNCKSDLFKSGRTENNSPTTYSTPMPTGSSPAPANTAKLGEYRECSAESSLKSPTSYDKSRVTFINSSPATVSVFWIDFDGKRKKYYDIAPGQRQTGQDTYKGHLWLIADSSGKCQQILQAPNEINIK